MMERIASCSCGQFTARVAGEPVRISICHCLACQRRTGGDFGAHIDPALDELAADAKTYIHLDARTHLAGIVLQRLRRGGGREAAHEHCTRRRRLGGRCGAGGEHADHAQRGQGDTERHRNSSFMAAMPGASEAQPT